MTAYEIYELFKIFHDSGVGSPAERLAAYQLAVSTPDLLIENEILKEKLNYTKELLKIEVAKNIDSFLSNFNAQQKDCDFRPNIAKNIFKLVKGKRNVM